jgi:hypothetical protein
MPKGIYVRRKRRKRKPKPKGYVAPPSPVHRATPWVSVSLRAEHYVMLRELGEFYEATLSALVASLVTEQFLKILELNNPEQAKQLREELRYEKNSKNLVDLNATD